MFENYALLVDDDPIVTDLLAAILDSRGYKSVAVNCGRDALQAIRASLPDFVVLDVNLPDIDGFEVLRTVRDDYRSCNVPVFMLTGQAEIANQLTSFNLGATEFFAKSTSLRKVIDGVEEVMWYRDPPGQQESRA